MTPRWQVFANTRGIPVFPELLRLIDSMRLRERTAAVGGSFQVFVHPWGPCGRAMEIEHLRPTADEWRLFPPSCRNRPMRSSEATIPSAPRRSCMPRSCGRSHGVPYGLQLNPVSWFLIAGNEDVFFNGYEMDPWCRLGNLAREPLRTIIRRFEEDDVPLVKAVNSFTPQELAQRYGDPSGRKVFQGVDDLLGLYLIRHFSEISGY